MIPKYSVDALRKASDHLFYEIWMVNRLAEILEKDTSGTFKVRPVAHTDSTEAARFVSSTGVVKSSKSKSNDEELRVVNNAIIEAFTIHIRALLDFFYSSERGDDVVAEHFFATPIEWIKARPEKTMDELMKIKDRVNKEVAHLTYARQKVKSNEWPSRELLNEINEVVEVFVAQVPRNLLGNRWK